MTVKQEFQKIRFTFASKLILLSSLWAFWSFFYRFVSVFHVTCQLVSAMALDLVLISCLQWYLVDLFSGLFLRACACVVLADLAILLHVSVRTKPSESAASIFLLGALLTSSNSVGCFGLGVILDIKGLSQRRRAQLGLYTVVLLNLGVYIWSIVMQVRFDHHNPGAVDWNDALYPSAFLPYFFVQTTGPLSQSYMYWVISSFATDAQSNVRNGAAFR